MDDEGSACTTLRNITREMKYITLDSDESDDMKFVERIAG
jgi:hypothetical protein